MKELAELIFQNGMIYTADEKGTVGEALVVKDGHILFVGKNSEAAEYEGKATQVIDLHGRMMLPGMWDTHIHPPGLSLSELYEVQLRHIHDMEGYVAEVAAFIRRHPGMAMIYGRGWSWGALEGEEKIKGPRREWLDRVAPDVPVVLRAHDGHTLWLNSKALEVSGIHRDTESPAGGIVEKDDQGELWGTLKESAMGFVALPQYSMEEYRTAMTDFQRKMHSFGITGILSMSGINTQSICDAYAAMDQAGELNLHVKMALTIRPQEEAAPQLERMEEIRRRYRKGHLDIMTAKFFADGVIEGRTGFLLQPYEPADGIDPEYRGEFLWREEELAFAFRLAMERKWRIHVHATGDGAVRKVLDAIEVAQGQLSLGDHRNVITHLQLVAEEDLRRFRDLGVIASVQPYWHYKGPNWWENVDRRLLGERAETEFPLASFFALGVPVTSSSDYPATHVPNPVSAMDVGVTRNMDSGRAYGISDIENMDDHRFLLNPAERATVEDMIHSFTRHSAYAMDADAVTGTLEAGKLADLVVLDRNILAVSPETIDQARVCQTYFAGKLVYEAGDEMGQVKRV